MKSLKWWFVVIMTTLTVWAIFLLADTVLMGLVALIISLFNKVVSVQVFKWGVAILFGVEFLLTIPAVLKVKKEGDEK